ncbi:DUF899 domain-containing protein [Bacillus sp. FJAT-29790]|nr:DUF899 domain-containing protein [Bacillus sp. FJAT-29790]
MSVFYRDGDGSMLHAYSTYARGIMTNTSYNYNGNMRQP